MGCFFQKKKTNWPCQTGWALISWTFRVFRQLNVQKCATSIINTCKWLLNRNVHWIWLHYIIPLNPSQCQIANSYQLLFRLLEEPRLTSRGQIIIPSWMTLLDLDFCNTVTCRDRKISETWKCHSPRYNMQAYKIWLLTLIFLQKWRPQFGPSGELTLWHLNQKSKHMSMMCH